MITPEQHRAKMQRRQQIQQQRLEACQKEKGLIIVHTGEGKGKTTAALGMVLRSLGHGYRVAIVQFIKGLWEPAEKQAFKHWGDQISFCAMGEGFTWDTQDRERDIANATAAWQKGLEFLLDPKYQLVLFDEINVAIKLDYLAIADVIAGIEQKPAATHAIFTGRGAKPELIAKADLVTEMKLIKHPFREQSIKAQPGIEF